MELFECLERADETKELVLKKNALEETPNLLDTFFPAGAEAFLICDENTYKAAGKRLNDILTKAGKKIAGTHIFPGSPVLHADYDHVRFLKKHVQGKNLVPFAVGAGTINDLVKCLSSELRLPYFCVPTAASVDGYTPNGAALLMDGFKKTIPCPAPLVLCTDTDIIAKAPAWLTSSGFGDLASKLTAGADWIIADIAGKHGAPGAPAIDPVCWAMIQDGIKPALYASVEASRGDAEAVNTLFQMLAITGFAMQYYKDSRPVSGSEHLFSHIWEMEDLCVNGRTVTHGHKVAIGTLATTAITEIFFADPCGPPPPEKSYARPSPDERKAEVSRAFAGSGDSRNLDRIIDTSLKKMMDQKTVNTMNEAFRDNWKEIRDRVLEKLLPYNELKALLAKSDCPLQGRDIGLDRKTVITTAIKAQMIRNRYGILDLAWDMGCLKKVLETIDLMDIYL